MQNGILRLRNLVAAAVLIFALPLHSAHASGKKKIEVNDIDVPRSLKDQLNSFEPSATAYLADLGAYLVAIDNTDDNNSPLLVLMDSQGRVNPNPLRIEGAGGVADMESLSQEGNILHVLSSQNKSTTASHQFVRVRRDGRRLQLVESMELRPLLLAALEKSPDPTLAGMRGKFAKKLDVESHFIMGGNLYIGLKDPQPKAGVGVIVALGAVDEIFRTKKLGAVKVWRKIDFSALGESSHRISDIVADGKRLLISSTTSSFPWGHGALWSSDIATGKLSLLEKFKDRSEGIATGAPDGKVMVVFDQQVGTSKYGRITVPAAK